jgi:lipopolysaccharide biosynthesis protein
MAGSEETSVSREKMDLLEQIAFNTEPGPYYEDDKQVALNGNEKLVRLLAYFLPQFHPIPENDLWWGKGFTEWTNVTKAIPRFQGHYQPRLPGELGFYDLRSADTLRQQVVLARRYGIHGFCFHHYWFGGKRLLETPLNNLLSMPDLDMPFCINWANENWTRRWNGMDTDILIAQKHSAKDDIAFAESLDPIFRDPRYIRINGRPLLMVYRPGVLPDPAATVERWRDHFRQAGIEDPYIITAQAYGNEDDPRKYGMNAAAGFPPHNCGLDAPRVQDTLQLFDQGFVGEVIRYETMAENALTNKPDTFRLFPGVCPNWNNEARKPNKGFCVIGSTPEAYGHWLDGACRTAMEADQPDERIVFVNAWNEWAEGAYLEPDRHFGYAYLAETARVLSRLSQPPVRKLKAESTKSLVVASSGARKIRRRIGRVVRKAANTVANGAEAFAKVLRF